MSGNVPEANVNRLPFDAPSNYVLYSSLRRDNEVGTGARLLGMFCFCLSWFLKRPWPAVSLS